MATTFERADIVSGRWDKATCEACGEEEATVLIFEKPVDICTSKVLVICSTCDHVATNILQDEGIAI